MFPVTRSMSVPGSLLLLTLSCSDAPSADGYGQFSDEAHALGDTAAPLGEGPTCGVSDDASDVLVRLAATGSDMNDLLANADAMGSLEKGKVPTLTNTAESGFPNCSLATCGANRPFQFAKVFTPGELAFFMPDTESTYYLVVDDGAPAFFTQTPANLVPQFGQGGLIGAAANRLQNFISMCRPFFIVLRNSAYQALPLFTRQRSWRTRITFGEFSSMCGGNAVACANFPRMATIIHEGATVQHLRFGDRVAFVTVPLVQPTTAIVELNEYAVGIATHELMHTMGFGHPQVSPGGQETRVPGTASGTTHRSIMHALVTDTNYRSSIQADDLLVYNRIYARDPEEDCDYLGSFHRITQ